MVNPEVQRRLAAILIADVAGYTRLMEKDTDGTVAAWQKAREEVIKPEISDHSGRIVKLTGDGFLVEFPTVQDAVNCALALQSGLTSSRLDFRIGINLGDIVDDGEDIHGEGVNIAARIEGLAEAGGICITGGVYDQVRNRINARYQDLGEHEVKNVSNPVRVYHVGSTENPAVNTLPPKKPLNSQKQWLAVAAIGIIAVLAGVFWWSQSGLTPERAALSKVVVSAKPTIAVLPFNNFSDDKAQEYFSDGLTEDLITDISKVSGLSVIARNSTFSYKGQSRDVREVGKTLGASHIIEGSVRKSGKTIRITVQLVKASDGQHIWAERYDRDLKDVFAIQDEVIGQIIKALSLKLTPQEKKRLARRGTDNLEAYDLFMKGRAQEGFFNKAAYKLAEGFFEQAIALDPNYADSYAHLAQIHALNAQFTWVKDGNRASQKALALAEKSVALNPDLPFAHWGLGRILVRPVFRQFDRAIKETEKAIELDPNYADSYAILGLYYSYIGQAEKTAGVVKKAMRINPIYPFWYHHSLGVGRFLLEDYAAAATEFNTALERNPSVLFIRQWYAAALAMAGDQDDAEWQVEEMVGLGFKRSLQEMMAESLVVDPDYRARFFEGLRKAGFK